MNFVNFDIFGPERGLTLKWPGSGNSGPICILFSKQVMLVNIIRMKSSVAMQRYRKLRGPFHWIATFTFCHFTRFSSVGNMRSQQIPLRPCYQPMLLNLYLYTVIFRYIFALWKWRAKEGGRPNNFLRGAGGFSAPKYADYQNHIYFWVYSQCIPSPQQGF